MAKKAIKSLLCFISAESFQKIFFNQYIKILVFSEIYPALQRRMKGRKLCANNSFRRQASNISTYRGIKECVKQHT